jgi:hypothetical protein
MIDFIAFLTWHVLEIGFVLLTTPVFNPNFTSEVGRSVQGHPGVQCRTPSPIQMYNAPPPQRGVPFLTYQWHDCMTYEMEAMRPANSRANRRALPRSPAGTATLA